MLNRLIKIVISLVYLLLEPIFSIIFCFHKKNSINFVVLTYHSVKPHQIKKFKKQMEKIQKTGRAVFADAVNDLDMNNCNIAVTFDDGFKNFYENAFPVLAEKKIPATVFVTTGFLGRLPGWIIDSTHENAREVLMTEEQLKSLPVGEIMIGAHCINHPRLTSLTKEKIIEELSGSKKSLESILNREINILSFPYDDYNDEIIELAKSAGYSHVFKDLPLFSIVNTDCFLLGRVSCSPDDLAIEFWLKIRGAYRWLPLASSVKKFFKQRIVRN